MELMRETLYIIIALFTSFPKDYKLLEPIEFKYYPFPGYRTLCWCGRLIYKGKFDPGYNDRTTWTHENIHLCQARKHSKIWLVYYIKYFWNWFIGAVYLLSWSGGYYTGKYECEAYAKEQNPDYISDYKKEGIKNIPSHWLKENDSGNLLESVVGDGKNLLKTSKNMIILRRLFSRTWENIKDPEKRTEKANELLAEREKINARRNEIAKKYKSNLKKEAFGKDTVHNIKAKDGTLLNLTSDEIKAIETSKLNKYINNVTENKHRTPPKPVTVVEKSIPKSGLEKALETGKKWIGEHKSGMKKAGYATIGAGIGTLAVSGTDKLYKKHKERNKENEIRERFNKNETTGKNDR